MDSLYRNIASLIVLLCIPFLSAYGEEAISRYEVHIRIQKDASLLIEEHITVHAEQQKIKRGIYRDFPTRYKDSYGRLSKTSFEVLSVTRDGQKEPFFLKNIGNGKRVYIGRKDTFIPRGEHTYTITFKTTRQIGFFDEHDELYFNAIPHGFEFPIEQALVSVYLPTAVARNALQIDAFTGRQGSREQGFNSWISDNAIRYATQHRLNAFEGMTVLLAFPKGIVEAPTTLDRGLLFLVDNFVGIFGGVAFLLLNGWFFKTWWRIGRDPKPGVIVPRWEAPEGVSATDLHYIKNYTANYQTMTTCLVSLATKGWVEVVAVDSEKVLRKKHGPEALEPEEQALYDSLFRVTNELVLEQENRSVLTTALAAMRTSLTTQHKGKAFVLHQSYVATFLSVIFLIFVVLVALATWLGANEHVPYLVFLFGALLALALIFIRLLRRPTALGRKILDQSEGLKMYLQTAEQDELRKMGAPEDSLAVYKKFLPYAVALGVDYEWGTRFKDIIEAALAAETISNNEGRFYRESYESRFLRGNGIGSDLSSVITSAAAAPSSSGSGFSGGSSGGGGGGGGGGGW